MEHRDDPATDRTFHAVDLSQLPLDSLALLTQEGDERAGNALWRRCDEIARPIARARGAAADDEWRDVLSEAVLHALQGFLPSRGRFRPYFSKVFTHALIDAQVRRTKIAARRSPLTDDADERKSYRDWIRRVADDDHAEYESELLARASAAAIDEFESATRRRREHQRWAAIARLRLLDRLSTAEIAERLGISHKDVYNCIGRHVHPTLRSHVDRIRLADSGDTDSCA